MHNWSGNLTLALRLYGGGSSCTKLSAHQALPAGSNCPDSQACFVLCSQVADDGVRLPAIGTKERDDRARKAGVPVDADDAKLLAAEHGTRLPDGHVVTITKDDLPSEDEDEAETAGDMGDFAASIGGADDY